MVFCVVGFVVYGFWVGFWLAGVNVLFGLRATGFGVCLCVGCLLRILPCGLALVWGWVWWLVGCDGFGWLGLVVLCGWVL